MAIGNEPMGTCDSRQTEITLQLGGGSSEPRFRFVGTSAATSAGDAGIFGLSTLCAEEFSGRRICMSREFIETVDPPLEPNPPSEPRVLAWIHPTFVPTFTVDSATNLIHYPRDISGQLARNCDGWSSSSTNMSGLSVYAYLGRF